MRGGFLERKIIKPPAEQRIEGNAALFNYFAYSIVIYWVATWANAADFPSRNALIPPPCPLPARFEYVCISVLDQSGLEVFSGAGILTASFQSAGFAMWVPNDLSLGKSGDILIPEVLEGIKQKIRRRIVRHIWLTPPCSSFSVVSNSRKGWPLRSKTNPEGCCPEDPGTQLGKALLDSPLV